MAPSWQQRQEAVCHPFNHTDPDTLWAHPSCRIKPFIFAFFKHPLSHPMRHTQWKHHWLHAVFMFYWRTNQIVWPSEERSHDVSKHQLENNPTTTVCTHLMSHYVIMIIIMMIRFACGSGGSFFNPRALRSTFWCVQQGAEYKSAPRAVP